MIDDIDIVAQINRVCNDVGVDTMDVGGAIGVCMEARLLAWGDGKAALDLVKEVGKKTEKGLMIGNGCRFTGEKLGVKRIPHVKGQCLAAYDPRSLKGTGVTYATSTMGADHTCGNAIPKTGTPHTIRVHPLVKALSRSSCNPILLPSIVSGCAFLLLFRFLTFLNCRKIL